MNKFFVIFSAFLCCLIFLTGNVSAAEITPKDFDSVPVDLYPENANNASVVYATNKSTDFLAVLVYNTSSSGNTNNYYKLSSTLRTDGTYDLYLSSYNDNTYQVTYKYSKSLSKWQLISGPDVRVNGYNNVCLSYVSAVHQTDVNIYDNATNDVVFPQPPTVDPTLEEVVTEGVNNLQAETVGTMGTLAIIAVGLLALLIGLAILPKILYRFL